MTTGNDPTTPSRPRARVVGRRRLVDRFIKLDVVDVEVTLPDGSTKVLERDIHDHGKAVAILPFDRRAGTVILVSQLRVPVLLAGEGDGTLVEVPAGLIDAGETAAETALRELREEAGIEVRDLEWVGDVYASPGSVTETVALYLAAYSREDRVGVGGGLASEDEDIEVLEWPLARFADALDSGAIRCAKTMALGFALRLRHPDLFA